ncbi:hypothetical protein CDL12_15145 [Handroanthus impetiginosus]|uniref:Auxin-responsive protein n=1 Tax=Handroanthus impetiginosus TaxID=429701 RepID=A0A2G9H420_9LAMI|nr:hypothetical protein CDL12_15145 [Handroanthus impetiginosus]
MSMPQEHDYIGLNEPLPMEKKPSSENEKNNVLNLKETELRLGLPGSGNGISLFGKDLKDEGNNGISQCPLKSFVSGAKRGFCDAIDSSGKWGFGGCEVDLARGAKSNNILQSCVKSSLKEICDGSPVKPVEEKKNENGNNAPASKAQVIGWPPIRSFRKNSLGNNVWKDGDGGGSSGCLYVKVSMDGAPYLRKIDLKTYSTYAQLSSALEKMFSCFTIGQYGHGLSRQEHLSESRLTDLLHGSEYVLTYEDKDGDWMLVGDVPWEMFADSCKRLRIMKSSDAIGLAPRTMQKCKSQN